MTGEKKKLFSKARAAGKPRGKATLEGAAVPPRLPKALLRLWTPAETRMERCQCCDCPAGPPREV